VRSHVAAVAEDGEFLTPHEVAAELRETVGRMHRIDRDNFPTNELDVTVVGLGAFGNVMISELESEETVDHNAGDNSETVYPIPLNTTGGGATVEPWILYFPSGDCELELSLSVEWRQDTDLTDPTYLWIGIRLDGDLVVRSPIQVIQSNNDSSYVVYTVPVPAGTHIVEPVYGIHEQQAGAALEFIFGDRVCAIREIAR
jgi:hypothetical protein